MRYLSDKLVTKKYIDDFMEQALIEVDIINDTTPKNINANFYAVAEINSYKRVYKLERSEFGVPWVRVLDNSSKTQGYPTPIALSFKVKTKYNVITWIDTDRDITLKLQASSASEILDEKQISKSDKPQRVVLSFVAQNGTMQPRLFFEGDFKGIRFTKYSIERVIE